MILNTAHGGCSARHPPAKLCGAGLSTVASPLLICSTARPRSLGPSRWKRNTPSAPLNPEALVKTVSLKRCGPCVRDKAATSETASYDSVANRVGLLLNLAL